jgi:hypothetical protein
VGAVEAATPWLTLPQAKRRVRALPSPLIFCEVGRLGSDACPVGWTPLLLDIRAARVRGYGIPRVLQGERKWTTFRVAASCGVDRLSARQFNAVFLWSYRAPHKRVETASPTDPGLAGVAHVGCKSPPSSP